MEESHFVLLKRVAQRFSNRDPDYYLRESLIRRKFETDVKRYCGIESGETESNITKCFGNSHQLEEVVFSKEFITRWKDDVDYFLQHLKKYGYLENVHWMENNGEITFNSICGLKEIFSIHQ